MEVALVNMFYWNSFLQGHCFNSNKTLISTTFWVCLWLLCLFCSGSQPSSSTLALISILVNFPQKKRTISENQSFLNEEVTFSMFKTCPYMEKIPFAIISCPIKLICN